MNFGGVAVFGARYREDVLFLLACSRPLDPSQALLPTQLSVLAERDDAPVSVVLDLRRNSRDQLDVRVSEGYRLWDGRHLWELSPTLDARGHGLHVSDLRAERGGEIPLFAASPLRLVSMTRRDAWIRLPNDAVYRCDLERPECVASQAEAAPTEHPGPGDGFALTLVGGELRLKLPFSPEPGTVLLDDVSRLIGVHWVHEAWLDHDPVLDRAYRGQASIVAGALSVVADGDLREWAGAEPLVVDAPWQIETGGAAWGGPRDSGFSVAAARSGEDLCFAGRVRDDDWRAGDSLTLHAGERSIAVDLYAASSPGVRHGLFSTGFEVCVASPPGSLAFSAVLHDEDADGVTMIGSARMDGASGAGTVRVEG